MDRLGHTYGVLAISGVFTVIIVGILAATHQNSSSLSIGLSPRPLMGVSVTPYEHESTGDIIYEINSGCWDVEVDGMKLFHGEILWCNNDLPTIKLLKFHRPKDAELPKLIGDIP